MNIGIIIIFHNNEEDIDTKVFAQQLDYANNIEFCLVNNASKDNTYQLLKEIKDTRMTNVSIIDIKKFKSDVAAVRAGARYLSNQFTLKSIGYVSTNLINIKCNGLSGLIKSISENRKEIIGCNIEALERQETKLTLFKSLFSVIDYLKKIKVENQFLNLQYLSKF
ncbi:glycosyltransferase [Lacinutrix neustonica]|uniref:Glycosyltransferase n=1 Tax=Lacinutrix neustonica TaxID=2980107 RepID=A0A9E8MW37_9FLAO|nr:glycosyltransferase [Lacinutrix neustonica]WAC01349.1 glycosyltransferase [Lacinutrix neustonica]